MVRHRHRHRLFAAVPFQCHNPLVPVASGDAPAAAHRESAGEALSRLIRGHGRGGPAVGDAPVMAAHGFAIRR